MIAKQLITSLVIPLKSSDTHAFAQLLMEEARLSHLPIVEDKKLIGVISQNELLAVDEPSHTIGHGDRSLSNVFVNENQHVYEVLKLFASLHLTLLPVVGNMNDYVGVIGLPAIVQSLAEMVGTNDPGGIIVLEIENQDYSLNEIVQIVESNDAKVLNCFVMSQPKTTRLEVTIKVNRIEIGSLLQAFFRLNYVVKASWSSENLYHEGLQDRFDALMNYLNI